MKNLWLLGLDNRKGNNLNSLETLKKNPFRFVPIISVLILLASFAGLSAQCPNTITLSTQEQVDNFAFDFQTCFEFDGHLIVEGNDITSLHGLGFLTAIYGSLEINDTRIIDLSGLEFVSTINGSISIRNNEILESLSGLEHITVLDSLSVKSNPNIVNYLGLNSLTSVDYLMVDDMPTKDFFGFESLQRTGSVLVSNNSQLGSLEGLGQLENASSISLSSNSNLSQLNGLDNLDAGETIISIKGSAALVNLEGFENFERIKVLELEQNPNMVSFDGLNNLKNIQRLNVFACGSLVDLNALSSLQIVQEDLTFSLCNLITDFSAFDQLQEVGRNMFISQLYNLVHLDDFENVKIGGDLFIGNNASLIDITGFTNVKNISGELSFNALPNLVSIEGFINMESNGGLIISRTEKLKDLTGLANLASVNGKLEIFENEVLENLDDLVSLTFVEGIDDQSVNSQKDVQIENNPQLTSIQGLNDLIYADDKIFIRNNPNLIICDVESICRFLSDPNIEITISNNGFPCNSPDQIRSDCNSLITDAEYNKCTEVITIEISDDEFNNNGLIDIIDDDGKIVCSINANGNNLGQTQFNLFVSSTDRYDDFNRPILRRNLSITSEFDPLSEVSVRIYFKDFEFERLKFLDPNIETLEDLRITSVDSICAGSFEGNPSLTTESDFQGNYLSNIDYYIEARFDAFANFFVHGPNELATDNDGDGYDTSIDCDDADSSVNPNAVEIPDNDIDENCDGILGITDLDNDGYGINEDCDDLNAAINPGATEILDNDIDEDCNGVNDITDADGDGFGIETDCDDNDPSVNPDAVEIIDNDIDEDCDGLIAITDIDNDGFGINDDCDDLNAAINPGATEIPDNNIDEDCDGILGVTDLDGDGFDISEDCNDADANIYPGAEEIPDNDIDEDCDGIFEITDEDNDGFGINEDCDDDNENVYPGAEEIVNNGIDEDCDGSDLTPILELDDLIVNIYPNPASEFLLVEFNGQEALQLTIIDLQGRVLLNEVIRSSEKVALDGIVGGTYLLKLSNDHSVQSTMLFISHE